MREYQRLQISFRTFMTEFKECKALQKNNRFQIAYVRNIKTRKKHIMLKKNNCQELDHHIIISKLRGYEQINEYPSINKFIGFVQEHYIQQKNGQKCLNLYLLYQFGEISLDTYIQGSSEQSRNDSLCLLTLIRDRLIQIAKLLLVCDMQSKWLSFNLKLISLQFQAESVSIIKFCYLPFSFLQANQQPEDFITKIYSLRELMILDSSQKSNEIQSLFQSKTQCIAKDDKSEGQMIQKIGLFILKLILLSCQDIHVRQNQVNLYVINKDFKIDYNWDLINPLIIQCQKQKDYKPLANVIQFMLFDSNSKTFQQCQRMIKQVSYQRSSQKKIYKSHSSKSSAKKQIKKQYEAHQISNQKLVFQNRQIVVRKRQQLQEKIKQLPNFVEMNHQNGRYVGQIVGDKRQGLGIYYFEEGEIYGGEWKNDQMIGNGIYLFMSQNQYYEGNVQFGTRSGFGCYYYKNGNIYKGNWIKDLKQGYGEFYSAENNETYKGNFNNNLQNGLGLIEYQNGSKFQGSFGQGMKQGAGLIYNSKEQITFKGIWVNNQLSGKAQIFFQNGDYYQGFTKNSLMHGQGLYKYKCGTIYIGQFIENNMSGKCTITYSNGDNFKGNISNGKFVSSGTYHYAREDVIEISQWINGEQSGNSELIHQEKSIVIRIKQRNNSPIIFNYQS